MLARSIEIGLMVLATVFGGALLGMVAGRVLPAHQLSSETRSVVTVSMGILGTLSALVLGLLISTANSGFAIRSQEVTQISADIIRLNRLLERYGPETQEIRGLLRRHTARRLQTLFPADHSQVAVEDETALAMLEVLQDRLLALAPGDEARRWLQAQALRLTVEIIQARWLLVERAAAIPFPFLLLMVFWLSILFASFGLFAPRNMVSLAALFLCAVGVSGTVLMIVDMETPFGGVIRVSSAPLRHALEVISR